MSTLNLRTFRALDTSDGTDTPYFIVFVGNGTGSASDRHVHPLRSPVSGGWDVSDGGLVQANARVKQTVTKDSTVLVALIEQDDGVDYDGQVLRNEVGPRVENAYALGTRGPKLREVFRHALAESRYNDDIIGVQPLAITTMCGQLPLLEFTGESAHYHVQFEMEK